MDVETAARRESGWGAGGDGEGSGNGIVWLNTFPAGNAAHPPKQTGPSTNVELVASNTREIQASRLHPKQYSHGSRTGSSWRITGSPPMIRSVPKKRQTATTLTTQLEFAGRHRRAASVRYRASDRRKLAREHPSREGVAGGLEVVR